MLLSFTDGFTLVVLFVCFLDSSRVLKPIADKHKMHCLWLSFCLSDCLSVCMHVHLCVYVLCSTANIIINIVIVIVINAEYSTNSHTQNTHANIDVLYTYVHMYVCV